MIVLRRIALFSVLWLIFESVISWAAFCEHGQSQNGHQYTAEEYQCIFKGPLVSILHAFARVWGRVFHDADAYVALFTAVLAVSTIGLWLATKRLWEAGERQMELIAKNADIARDAFNATIAADRPWVRLSKLTLVRLHSDEPYVGNGVPTIKARFKNHGRSTGVIVGGLVNWQISGTLPDEPDYSRGMVHVQLNKTLDYGDEYEFPMQVMVDVEQYKETENPILIFKAWLRVFGYIKYLDHMGKERTHGFAAIWMPPGVHAGLPAGEQFSRLRVPNYDYEK